MIDTREYDFPAPLPLALGLAVAGALALARHGVGVGQGAGMRWPAKVPPQDGAERTHYPFALWPTWVHDGSDGGCYVWLERYAAVQRYGAVDISGASAWTLHRTRTLEYDRRWKDAMARTAAVRLPEATDDA